MTPYRDAIEKATGVTDPARIQAIDAVMRLEHPTLDWLPQVKFRREARLSNEVVGLMLAEGKTLAEIAQ